MQQQSLIQKSFTDPPRYSLDINVSLQHSTTSLMEIMLVLSRPPPYFPLGVYLSLPNTCFHVRLTISVSLKCSTLIPPLSEFRQIEFSTASQRGTFLLTHKHTPTQCFLGLGCDRTQLGGQADSKMERVCATCLNPSIHPLLDTQTRVTRTRRGLRHLFPRSRFTWGLFEAGGRKKHFHDHCVCHCTYRMDARRVREWSIALSPYSTYSSVHCSCAPLWWCITKGGTVWNISTVSTFIHNAVHMHMRRNKYEGVGGET